MSIQVLKPPMTAGQAFGQSLNEGLKEHFADNVKRGSVAGGLKKLSEQSGSLSPLDMYQKLWSIPGMDAQTASQIHPLLQQQQVKQVRQAVSQPQGPLGEQAQAQPAIGEQAQAQPTQLQQEPPNYFGMPTPPAEMSQKSDIVSSKIGADSNLVLEEIKRQDDSRVTRQQQNISDYNDRVQKILSSETDKGIRDKLGSLVKSIGLDNLAEIGSTKDLNRNDITNLVGDIYDFAKSKNNLENLGRTYASSVFNRKNTTAKFNSIKKGYEKFGIRGSEQFRDDLISYNKLSAPTASRMAFPYSNSMRTTLEKIKPSGPKFAYRKTPESIFENIHKNLTTSDSLLAIGLDLQEKGYDGSAFLTYMVGKTLTEAQNAEISMIPTAMNQFKPTLGDVFLETNLFSTKRRQ